MNGTEEEKNEILQSDSSDLDEKDSSFRHLISGLEDEIRLEVKEAKMKVFKKIKELLPPQMVVLSRNYFSPVVIIKYNDTDGSVLIWINDSPKWIPIEDLLLVHELVGCLGDDFFNNYFMFH